MLSHAALSAVSARRPSDHGWGSAWDRDYGLSPTRNAEEPKESEGPITRHALGEFEQLILLAVVRLGRDAYGVRMRQEIQARTGRTVSAGAIYTALERLESRGLVASRLDRASPQRRGRPRKYYRLQPAGADALSRSYQALSRMADGIGPALDRLGGEEGGT